MRCPDDARLDLWLDDALAAADAGALAAHVADCAACATRHAARQTEEAGWRAALALDAAELAYLAGANLTAWRAAMVPARSARWWPALVLLTLAGAYAAWVAALPTLGLLVGVVNRVGLLGWGAIWALGQVAQALAAAARTAAEAPVGHPATLMAGAACLLWLALARPWALGFTR
jgi:hypothetical protein